MGRILWPLLFSKLPLAKRMLLLLAFQAFLGSEHNCAIGVMLSNLAQQLNLFSDVAFVLFCQHGGCINNVKKNRR